MGESTNKDTILLVVLKDTSRTIKDTSSTISCTSIM